jgi:hypothetical protein
MSSGLEGVVRGSATAEPVAVHTVCVSHGFMAISGVDGGGSRHCCVGEMR